ncbi:MAG TPA: transglutaminase-like domain-containing protein [Rhizomicrobium sp.]|jgi:regulator of sirC expression with transglutaminase-like and TPR domain
MRAKLAAMTQDDPAEFLRQLGEAGDGPHDIARAALMLSALDHSGRMLEPYEAHLVEIAEAAKTEARLTARVEDGARSLAALMVGRYGYDGDRLSYDDPKNADIMAVIDRRRGLPVALGVLYLHAARAAGFEAKGLNYPGHFLLSVSLRGYEALIDPFNGGAALDRERLGAPPAMGAHMPDGAQFSETVSDIDVLLRLTNNLKLRALNNGERVRALEISKRMVLIAPKRPELWMDLARLNEVSGALGAAQRAYEACLSLVPGGQSLHNEAALGLHALKRRLN